MEYVVLNLMFYNWKLDSAESGQGYGRRMHRLVQGTFAGWANRISDTNVGQRLSRLSGSGSAVPRPHRYPSVDTTPRPLTTIQACPGRYLRQRLAGHPS